jgi:signal peptidase
MGKKYEPLISLYTIISPSMEPNIRVYDVVITKKTNANDIKEGDVITFISTSTLGEGLTITHRVKSVIKTENDVKFRTQGDNNDTPDSALVTSNNLLGKVVFTIPQLGRIQFLLQSKEGWLFCLLIPAIIVVVYDVVKVLKLSNVKQRLNNTLKEEEKDEKLAKKQEKLKENLQNKYKDFGLEKTNINKPEPEQKIDESIFEYQPTLEENDYTNQMVEEPIVKEVEKIAPNINNDELSQTREEAEEMFEKVKEVKSIESHQEETKEQIKIKNFDLEDDNEIVLPKLK